MSVEALVHILSSSARRAKVPDTKMHAPKMNISRFELDGTDNNYYGRNSYTENTTCEGY